MFFQTKRDTVLFVKILLFFGIPWFLFLIITTPSQETGTTSGEVILFQAFQETRESLRDDAQKAQEEFAEIIEQLPTEKEILEATKSEETP